MYIVWTFAAPHRPGIRIDRGILVVSLGWLLISFGSDAQRRRAAGK